MLGFVLWLTVALWVLATAITAYLYVDGGGPVLLGVTVFGGIVTLFALRDALSVNRYRR